MVRAVLVWTALTAALGGPVLIAATSPLLAWREPVYIGAGFAGVVAMALLLLQPLLAGGHLPGLTVRRSRGLHRIVGTGLVICVLAHVLGLWITSPPDVIDALLFRSPTPFSAWGVIAMWAVLATALVAGLRRRLRLKPKIWQRWHLSLAVVIVCGSVVHAVLIEGTMEVVSKVLLCVLVLVAAAKAFVDVRPWTTSGHRKT